ncbi:hypothetical protein KIL84_006839 [Mauremys mutica]|uniref:Uncharacterized protein n=1 Tax=Mauremys mutica TaxID=74926 RepID=A0A9D3X1N6_9SAUR|nr:hypothetical protein KIL84_006839 [Mauremys mutica]
MQRQTELFPCSTEKVVLLLSKLCCCSYYFYPTLIKSMTATIGMCILYIKNRLAKIVLSLCPFGSLATRQYLTPGVQICPDHLKARRMFILLQISDEIEPPN